NQNFVSETVATTGYFIHGEVPPNAGGVLNPSASNSKVGNSAAYLCCFNSLSEAYSLQNNLTCLAAYSSKQKRRS
ncbi:MAG TPA: hypothetical protein VEG25_08030, partial [Burkholderiales bacterium]|nr:hypothetical protein [Burkholderiales bacterium]